MMLKDLNRGKLNVWLLVSVLLNFCSADTRADDYLFLKRFLEKPQNVNLAIFTKAVEGMNIPEAAKRQTFSMRWQPGGYYVQVLPRESAMDTAGPDLMYGGRHAGKLWEIHNGKLTYFDPQINAGFESKNPVSGAELVFKVTANTFLKLGLLELKSGTLVWSGDSFTAESDSGRRILGRLVQTAKSQCELQLFDASSNAKYGFIEYAFDESFNNGQFPIRIARSNFAQDGKPLKLFELKCLKVELADAAMPSAMFDPTKFLSHIPRNVFLYSNGILFEVSANKTNSIEPMMTIEQANASLERVKREDDLPAKPGRFGILIFITSSAVLAILFGFVIKKKGVK